jgi:MFS family permease
MVAKAKNGTLRLDRSIWGLRSGPQRARLEQSLVSSDVARSGAVVNSNVEIRLSDAASQLKEDKLYRKVIWRIFPLFFLGFVFSYLDRINISFAKLQMAAEFGLSDASFAVGASVFFWGYMLFEVPSNLVLQRVGARAWIARIMITWGIISMMMVFSRNQTAFYVLRFLLGACEAGFVPGVMYYTNTWLPARRQSGMYSRFLMALPLSIVIGAPISGAILDSMNGVLGLRAWHWLFILEGAPCILLGFVILVFLRNKPADVNWLSEPEKEYIESNVTHEAGHKLTRVGDMLRCGKIYLLILTMIMFNAGFYGLTFWLPTVFRNSGVESSFHIGLFTAIPFGCAAVSMYLNARHAEKTGGYRLHGTVSILLASAGLFLATFFYANFWFSLAMLTVAASGILALMPIFWTLPGRLLSGTAAAAGLALINSCGSLSGVLGSLLIGYLGVQAGMYTLAALLTMCGLMFFFICPSREKNEDI